jgi:hypothetical protein
MLLLLLLRGPQPIRILHTGGKCACSGAFSPDGQLLAVGLRCGGVKVYEFHPTTRQVRAWGQQRPVPWTPCVGVWHSVPTDLNLPSCSNV